MRSLLSILLIGVPVTLILSLVGLSHGMLEDSQRRARGVGADIIVRGAQRFGDQPQRPGARSEAGRLPREAAACRHGGGRDHRTPSNCRTFVTGLDLERFDRMSGGFTYAEGGPFRGPDDILIDRSYAAQKHAGRGRHTDPDEPQVARGGDHRRRQAGADRRPPGDPSGSGQLARQSHPDLRQAGQPGQHQPGRSTS